MRTILAILSVAATTATAWADLAPSRPRAAAAVDFALIADTGSAEAAFLRGDPLAIDAALAFTPTEALSELDASDPESPATGRGSEDAAAPAIRELPGAPGSAGLVLSALLTVGAWQCTRKATQLRFGHVPDWYHTGAPDRIGHTVALDLNLDNLLPCPFDAVVAAPALAPDRFESPPTARLLAQCALTLAAPRGPPICSF